MKVAAHSDSSHPLDLLASLGPLGALGSLDGALASRLLRMQLTLTRLLNHPGSPEETLPAALGFLCSQLDWTVSVLWLVSEESQTLRSHTYWSDDQDSEATARQAEFKELSLSLMFPKDIGIPGRVWASRQAMWCEDVRTDPNFPRFEAARAARLGSAYCFPLVSKGDTIGVIEFFADRIERLDDAVLACLHSAGHQLALYLRNTQVEKRAARSRETIRNQEDLIQVITHEVRNPLNVILLNALLLHRHLQPQYLANLPPTVSPMPIVDAAREIQTLLQDVEEATKAQAGRGPIKTERRLCQALVNDAITRMSLMAEQKGIHLEPVLDSIFEPGPMQDLAVQCDSGKVLRIFHNLIANSLKFTDVGGTVRVGVEQDPESGKPIFFVEDTGRGISAQDLSRVFERRWQAPATAHLGKGLGLWIAREIVHAHDGKIWVESAPGVGSKFSFTLGQSAVAHESQPDAPLSPSS
jgi:signal transduction histidine kinase